MPYENATEITKTTRLQIGFPKNRSVWANTPAVFSQHNLKIFGHPVMEDWETEYMRKLAEVVCKKGGDILEVGFGMGISARIVQQQDIFGHWIIEANRDVYVRLLAFSGEVTHPVYPHFGFWEEVCPGFPECSFSGILFDTYPLKAEEIHQNHFAFFEEAYRLLRPGGVLTYYSDEAKNFSDEHISRLRRAGFTNIDSMVCSVNPPPECEYWQTGSLLVPIITK